MLTIVRREEPDASLEMQAAISDMAIGCVQGVLLCLDRKHRLVFILAVVLDVSDAQGGKILGISRADFRRILSQACAWRPRRLNSAHGQPDSR